MNREEQSILAAYKNNTLIEIASEKARRNESGFTFGWTVEQHLERITKKAIELVAAEENAAKEAAKKVQTKSTSYKSIFGVSADGEEDMLYRRR